MGLRDRHNQRKEERREFGIGGTAARFQMRQKMLAFGDDFWIQNGDGQRVYRIDGKVLRLRHTMILEDAHGDELCKIQTRVMHIRDTMAIEDADGNTMASVHQALITPIRERWKVDVENGEDLEIHGNIVDHEYTIEADGHKVAEVSKRWFRVRDTYGVQIGPTASPVLILAVSAALDAMAHPAK